MVETFSRHLLLDYYFKYWCVIFTFTLNVYLVTLWRLPNNIKACLCHIGKWLHKFSDELLLSIYSIDICGMWVRGF